MLTTRYFGPMLLALAGLAAGACAHAGRGQATAPGVEATPRSAQLRATRPVAREALRTSIESVDERARSLTVRDADGRPFTIVAADPESLKRLHPHDPVRLVYQQTLGLLLEDAQPVGSSERPLEGPALAPGASADAQGTAFWRRVNTVVEILAVAPEGRAATFRNPEGSVRRVEVGDMRERERVAKLHPGDEVAVAFTEKLVLERE